jgi:large subunit ribosomal protein L7/L12
MADLQSIAENLSTLTVMEASQLVKMLEEKWGVSAAAPVAVAAAAAPGAAAAAVEEKTEFEVVLKEVGENKINVIKVVREVTSLGVTKDDAEAMKKKFEAVGAKVEVK